jgi:hypothetical protein
VDEQLDLVAWLFAILVVYVRRRRREEGEYGIHVNDRYRYRRSVVPLR